MFENKGKLLKDRLYRGAYIYSRNNVDYSEEKFEVYKEKGGVQLNFVSEVVSRISTGELLTMNIDYYITKDYKPFKVTIERKLGSELITEQFNYNKRSNVLSYKFTENKKKQSDFEIQAPTRFYISTPAACASLIFLKSKKFESNGLNLYSSISSVNRWIYEDLPQITTLGVKRFSDTATNILVRGANLSAVEYKITEEDLDQIEADKKKKAKSSDTPNLFKPGIKAYMSKHLTIPYLIQTDDGTKIEIKYLNDFTDKD